MGLEAIFGNGSGAYDSVVQGEQDYMNRQKTLSDITRNQLANEQSKAMNPLLQEQQRLVNRTSEAQLPGVVGNSQSLATKGKIDSAGIDDQIRLKAREAYGKLQESQLHEIARTGQAIGMLAAKTAHMKPMERAVILGNKLQEFGFKPDSQELHSFMAMTPEQLTQVSNFMALAEPKYLQDMSKDKFKEDAATERTRMNNQTQLDVANIYAKNRGGQGSDFLISLQTKMKTARDKHAALISEAERIRQENPEQAALYERMANAIRPQAEAEIKSATPGALDVPGVAGLPAIPAPQIGPRPAVPQQAPNLEQAVRAAGQTYEPNKYDYRVLPDGRVQRKPK